MYQMNKDKELKRTWKRNFNNNNNNNKKKKGQTYNVNKTTELTVINLKKKKKTVRDEFKT